MRSFLILSFILFFFSTASAQQTIDKLNVNELKLPKESVSKALYLDAFGKVKASADITDTELGYLNGLSDTLVNLLSGKANSTDTVNLTGNQSISGIKTFTGKLVASSTINGSVPCPVMTQIQRDATTPANGECVFNSTTLRLNVYDGSIWKDVGGAGGISLWVTANPYAVNDIVIESDKIYRCTTIHTSGTFATDLGSGYWVEVSASPSTPYSLANGGTNKALAAVNGGIVWVDADSFEILSAGVSGQVLQSNGASAPSWVNKSISAKSENNASVVAEELQVPNNQLTLTDTNKHLVETGNNNILVNPGFENSTFSTGWVNSAGTFTDESSVLVHGKKSAKLVLSAQTMSLTQSSTLYQAQFADSVPGIASVFVKSNVALKVCSIQAGVVSSTNCQNVPSTNTWGNYIVKFNMGGTSNGISIASTGSVSGTVYIDNAFVGVAQPSTEACASTLSCTDVFSAKVSGAGVVSAENVDWINGNCITSSGQKSCTFNSSIFTVAPNCVVTPSSSNGQEVRIDSITASVISLTTYLNSSQVADSVNIVCQKQGVDYIGKTINAVASDQNVATPGATKAVQYSAKISSAGIVSDELGDFINGNCSGSSPYTCNFNANTFSSVNCVCSVSGTTATSCRVESSSSSSSVIRTISGAPATLSDSFSLICHGVKP